MGKGLREGGWYMDIWVSHRMIRQERFDRFDFGSKGILLVLTTEECKLAQIRGVIPYEVSGCKEKSW